MGELAGVLPLHTLGQTGSVQRILRAIILGALMRGAAHPVLCLISTAAIVEVVRFDSERLLVPPLIWIGFGLVTRLVGRESLPGLAVRPAAEPELTALVARIAAQLNFRAPIAIRIIPMFDASLMPTRLRGTRAYALVLGWPLLRHFSQAQVAAIVAHELAHQQHLEDRLAVWLLSSRADLSRSLDHALRLPTLLTHALLRVTQVDAWAPELAADRDSAGVVGASVCRAALHRSDQVHLAYETAGDWLEHLETLNKRALDLYDAMADVLSDPVALGRLEQAALDGADVPAHPADTHPPTSLRLAALPETPGLQAVPFDPLLVLTATAIEAWCIAELNYGDEEATAVRLLELEPAVLHVPPPHMVDTWLQAVDARTEQESLQQGLLALQHGSWQEQADAFAPEIREAPVKLRERLWCQAWLHGFCRVLSSALVDAGWTLRSRWIPTIVVSPVGEEYDLRELAKDAMTTADTSALELLVTVSRFEEAP